MNRKFNAGNWFAYIIIAIPAIYLACIYGSLPDTVPTHFGLHGADKWGEKAQSWVFLIIMSVVGLFLYVLLNNLSFIDPKKNLDTEGSLIRKMSLLLVVFFSILQLIIISSMQGNTWGINKLLLPVMSLFFALIGNLMVHIKPNYFVGIRVPWTLENEENWRKTHQLAGRLWFPTGILLCIITLLLPFEYAFVAFMVGLGALAIIPIVYSYNYFRKQRNQS